MRGSIIISGLTAAGKTTHATRLAEDLGYGYVSASEVLQDLAGVDAGLRGRPWLWADVGSEVAKKRDNSTIDDEVDDLMRRLADEREETVFDAWALPWISTQDHIRVWLESDHRSRTLKCMTSYLPERRLTTSEAARIIDTKDVDSRGRFLRRHHFDIFESREAFDLLFDISRLIEEPTLQAAESGIAQFRPVLATSCRAILHPTPATRDAALSALASFAPGVPLRLPPLLGSSRVLFKVAAVIVREGKLAVVRKKSAPPNSFILPGGKPEPGEEPTETLARELMEELNVTVRSATFLEHCEERAEYEEDVPLFAQLYRVEVAGAPAPNAEIAELLWLPIAEQSSPDIHLGSVITTAVIPHLRTEIR